MAEEPGNVTKTIGLVAMDRLVVFGKRAFKQISPETIELGETFANEAVEFGVCSLLRTTFDDHGRQFRFLSWWEVYLIQLISI